MSDFTKKEKNSSMPSSLTGQEQLVNYFQTIQVSLAHLSPYLTENHEFWYCSRSRLMHNSSKTTGSNQDVWEMGKCNGKPITIPIPVLKGLRE